jgi:hypothetical protein
VSAGDRALQDALIRLLADASFRASLLDSTGAAAADGVDAGHAAVLRATNRERVHRFARFLARGYYHERITHFYKYSRVLARWTGRQPHDVLRDPAFDALLDRIVLGSRASARAIAQLVERHLGSAAGAPPYTGDLLRYESAQMIVEAGPRVWRDAEPVAPLAPDTVATRNPDALVLDFAWDLPPLLPALLAAANGTPSPTPPPAERAPTQLLFARSPRGRVTVMRWSPTLAALITAMDGTRELRDVAALSRIPEHDVVEIAAALTEAGAVHAG